MRSEPIVFENVDMRGSIIRNHNYLRLALAGFIVLLFVMAGSVKTFAKDTGEVIPVYRLYNETNKEHLYTSNPTEREMCISVGWVDEGIGWYAPQQSDWPVRRLYHAPSGSHVYSQNPVEMDMLVNAGWKLEGVAFYFSQTKAVEVQRQYLPSMNLHNYSYNPAEIELLRSAGWKIEGTAWYACDPQGKPIGKTTEDHQKKIDWITIYLNLMNEITPLQNLSRFRLIHVNNDGVPELEFDTGIGLGGETVYTINNGNVEQVHSGYVS